jgi:hypothetical protein
MQNYRLDQLHGRTIAIEVGALTRRMIMRGVGKYERTGEFGPALRIEIPEGDDTFELVLKEDEWDGQIETGERFNCDFAFALNADCPFST